jgi:hypothetical protein
MNQIRTISFLIGAAFCAKYAYGCYQSLREAQAGSALVNGVAGLFGQRTNFDFGEDARNELVFWCVCTGVCLWIALKPGLTNVVTSK